MATTDLEKLIVKLDADLKSYEKGLARAQGLTVSNMRKIEKQAQSSAQRVEAAFGKMGKAFKSFGAGFLGGFSIERAIAGISQSIKSMADIGDAADKLGMTVKEYQELAFVAKLAGVEVETFNNGMKKLAVNSSEAARGTGEFSKILAANNVSITDANGHLLSQQQILEKTADLVRNAANEQDKAAIAMAAMGKAGVDNLNLLSQGAEGVREAMAKARAAGVAFTEEQIRKAQELDDKWDTLAQTITVALQGTIVGLADDAVQAIDDINDAVVRLGEQFQPIIDAFKEIDRLVREYGPFSERTKQGTLFGGVTVNRAAKSGMLPMPTTAAAGPAGPPTKMPVDVGKPLDIMGDKVRKLTDEQKALNETLDAGQSAIKDFITDIAHGVGPIEAMISALDRLADRLLEIALDAAMNAALKALAGGAAGAVGGAAPKGGMGLAASALYHKGGKVGAGGWKRPVHPAAFAGAPRMHNGGEVPAILQKGEIVLPKNWKGGGQGYGHVTVNNYGGQVEQRETQGPGGERRLELQFNAMFDKRLGGQSAQRILGTAYGVTPRVTRR